MYTNNNYKPAELTVLSCMLNENYFRAIEAKGVHFKTRTCHRRQVK